MHELYELMSYLAIGGLLPVWALHPKLRAGFRQRLGLYRDAEALPTSDGPRVWFHGASAGDLLALRPMVSLLRERVPNAFIVASAITKSGFEMAGRCLGQTVDQIVYMPFDLPGATRRALAHLRPDLLVLEYTEIWPNFIQAARDSGARVVMTNGRLSEDHLRRYRWLQRIAGNQLRKFDMLLMRTSEEAERALLLGAQPAQVHVTGNTKFDNLSEPVSQDLVGDLAEYFGLGDAPLWVAASTHEGEEMRIIEAYLGLRANHPKLRLLLAPRYPERARRVGAMAEAKGLEVAYRRLAGKSEVTPTTAPVMVLDSIGELSSVYALATIVFVGGSFVRRGGQNILEPASMGCPVIFGPNMANFKDSVEILLGRGGIQVRSQAHLVRVLEGLLANDEERLRVGAMARSSVGKSRGASARNVSYLIDVL
jgi:3-deoxy-D-manno-octulosonic-acid transferase